MYKEIFDRVADTFAGSRYETEVRAARDKYFVLTGKVFEDEPYFEQRMTAFLEWYVFDWWLKDFGVPPIRLYAEINADTCTKEEAEIFQGLQETNHSLFEFMSRSRNGFRVKDLYRNEIHEVRERRHYAGITRGDLIDARAIPHKEEILFSDAMWIHPPGARSFILGEVRKRREQDQTSFRSFLLDLAYMKLKSERYRHLSPEKIYSPEFYSQLDQERSGADARKKEKRVT